MNTSKISLGHYLDGRFVTGQGTTFVSTNPANGETLWQGNNASADEILQAVLAANRALPQWSAQDMAYREVLLKRFAKVVLQRRDELAYLIAVETGKPLWEALTEVQSVVAKIDLSIQACNERTADKETIMADATGWLRYKPHGVVAVLGPFNFPAHISNGHIIPALLAGNTVVYKPSEQTPLVAEFILQCFHECAFPAGVINGIQGNALCAKQLLSADIQGVYFTGSFQAGLAIHKQFSERPEVMLALEMGGNNPLIIDTVKDITAAVYQTILSTLLTSGQRCTSARRVLIPNNAHGDTFLKALLQGYKKVLVAAFTTQPEPFMGPVISHAHAVKHLEALRALQNLGGQTLLPMTMLADNTGFLSPGIIDMTTVISPPDEEIFAPLTQIYRYDDFEHALSLANQTRYGLSAGIFSDDLAHYQKFYQTIRAGLINWNRPTTGALSQLPFGGIGKSGNHRPSAYFAADYCAYPIASVEKALLVLPELTLPGVNLDEQNARL